MQAETFTSENNFARAVLIGSPTKQSTNGRICVPVRMPLTGDSLAGLPDWVVTAYEAVSKYLEEATPNVDQVPDLSLAFYNDQPKGKLFDDPSVKVAQGELRGFSVVRAGEAEQFSVELTYKVYSPFTRDFWKWLGEMAGEEVFMAFPKNLGWKPGPGPEQQKLIDQAPGKDEAAILKKDDNPPGATGKIVVVPPVKKTGPVQLKEFNERIEKAAKKPAAKPATRKPAARKKK